MKYAKTTLFDGYNLCVTGGVSKTLTGQRVDVSNIPILFFVDGGDDNDTKPLGRGEQTDTHN